MNEAQARQFLAAWALTACGLVLLRAAVGHRLQLEIAGPGPYRSNPLIAIEIILIPIMWCVLLGHIAEAGYLLWRRRLRDLGLLVVNVVVGIACLAGAMSIDAPTLLYMT